MKVAICGSRVFTNYQIFEQHVKDWENQYGSISLIISGGASGVDQLAERYAKDHQIEITIFKPDYSKYPGKIAPLIRNQQIVDMADYLIAFPTEQSRGTWDTVTKARKKGILVRVNQV